LKNPAASYRKSSTVRKFAIFRFARYCGSIIVILAKYQACKREDIEKLICTPAIRSLISNHMARVNELLKGFRDAKESSDINDDESP
jgi:hypothetical protein